MQNLLKIYYTNIKSNKNIFSGLLHLLNEKEYELLINKNSN